MTYKYEQAFSIKLNDTHKHGISFWIMKCYALLWPYDPRLSFKRKQVYTPTDNQSFNFNIPGYQSKCQEFMIITFTFLRISESYAHFIYSFIWIYKINMWVIHFYLFLWEAAIVIWNFEIKQIFNFVTKCHKHCSKGNKLNASILWHFCHYESLVKCIREWGWFMCKRLTLTWCC